MNVKHKLPHRFTRSLGFRVAAHSSLLKEVKLELVLSVCRMIEGIGMKHVDFVPVIVPVLLSLLQDATPAVARRAITSGSNIFRSVLEQVALQVQSGSC